MKRILIISALFILNFGVAKSQDFTGSDRPFSNPSFMFGTNIGQFMQTLYRYGKYDEMLKFTSSESIKKYGKEAILNYYQDCDFGYVIKLKGRSQEGNYIILSYNVNIMATNKVMRMKTIVENDSAKVVLDNLKIIK